MAFQGYILCIISCIFKAFFLVFYAIFLLFLHPDKSTHTKNLFEVNFFSPANKVAADGAKTPFDNFLSL